MDTKTFLENFGHIADAPNGIAKLRDMILDLAIQGKLGTQNTSDTSAEKLVREIKEEKNRIYKVGKIKKPKAWRILQDMDAPFTLPNGWYWVYLGDVLVKLTDGTHHSPTNTEIGEYKYVTAKNIKNDGILLSNITYVSKQVHHVIYARCNPEFGDILYIKDGATTGIVTINTMREPFSMLSSVALLKLPKAILNQYLLYVMRSPFFYDEIRGEMSGVAITRVTLKKMDQALIPLPPLEEQKRIVAKVDQLMALCDQLETQQKQKAQTRVALNNAALNKLLTAQYPDEFNHHWQRIASNFHHLYDNLENLNKFRETILELAILGKLVPQAPNDEPAFNLLKRVRSELEKKAKTKKNLIKLDVEPSISLPPNWSWSTAQGISRDGQPITYGILKPVWVSSGVPTVRVSEMKTGVINVDELPRCQTERASKFSKTTLEEGDLLISKDGTIGKTAFVPPELKGGNITQHVLRFPITEHVNRHYIKLCIDSPYCQHWVRGETKGVALQGINVGDFRRMPLPIPPVEEQKRIVAKVDQLMALCDQLETKLKQTHTTSENLVEATVKSLVAA